MGRSGEPRSRVEVAAVQQDYLEFVTQICPRGIARGAFGYEHGYNFRVADALESVAVAQHLAEAEAKLFFLVVVGDALDLGDEGGAAFLPGQVEVRFVRQTGTGCQARTAEDSGKLVLGIGMPAQAALDNGGVGGEGLPGTGICADLCGPVVRAEQYRSGLWFR
jgi:hypothetical protein